MSVLKNSTKKKKKKNSWTTKMIMMLFYKVIKIILAKVITMSIVLKDAMNSEL